MGLQLTSTNACFGGTQESFKHFSEELQCEMKFSIYTPPQAKTAPCPVLFWLSGLTCTDENFTIKAGGQKYASKYGFIVVAPDTSPRGDGIPDDKAYDFGQGAGFYINAISDPWAKNYQMYSYITEELSNLIFENFPGKASCQGIFGHSMGGHGALVIALRNPETFRSVSAFSPIVTPSQVPWGKKALSRYLGENSELWKNWDATELVKSGNSHPGTILIDQGTSDEFLHEQLQPEAFQNACNNAKQAVNLRMQDGYDHSYFFVASFLGEHFAHHASELLL